MVNEQILNETIQRMIDAGIDEPTIITTLTEAGLSREEAINLIQKVRSPPAPPVSQQVFSQPNQSEQAPKQVIDAQIVQNELAIQSEANDLNQAALHNKLDLHEQKIDEVMGAVSEVKQVISSVSSSGETPLSIRITAIEQKLAEVNAGNTALLELLKQILETDRRILTNLEAQK